jgi:hypothetical protein
VCGLPSGLLVTGSEAYMRVWQRPGVSGGDLERVGARVLPPPTGVFVDEYGQLVVRLRHSLTHTLRSI